MNKSSRDYFKYHFTCFHALDKRTNLKTCKSFTMFVEVNKKISFAIKFCRKNKKRSDALSKERFPQHGMEKK